MIDAFRDKQSFFPVHRFFRDIVLTPIAYFTLKLEKHPPFRGFWTKKKPFSTEIAFEAQ